MAEHTFIAINPLMKDATGERHGKLIVNGPIDRAKNGRLRWLASCECGGKCIDHIWNIRQNTSCGCHRQQRMSQLELSHGHARAGKNTKTYRTWCSMRLRCNNPNHEQFKHYGARGIKICDRWKDSFQNFLDDMGERPVGMTIDRIDGDGNYEPSNCRWATAFEQRVNMDTNITATLNGVRVTAGQAAKALGLSPGAIRCRLKAGWDAERAFTTPRLKPPSRFKQAK